MSPYPLFSVCECLQEMLRAIRRIVREEKAHALPIMRSPYRFCLLISIHVLMDPTFRSAGAD